MKCTVTGCVEARRNAHSRFCEKHSEHRHTIESFQRHRGVRVYLAGPIFGASDDDVHVWREEAKRELAWATVLDPSDRDFRGMEDVHASEIVETDLASIVCSDWVLVYAERPSWGTAMEVLFAHQLGRRVVVVCPGSVSPWLCAHSEAIVKSVKDACAVIRGVAP